MTAITTAVAAASITAIDMEQRATIALTRAEVETLLDGLDQNVSAPIALIRRLESLLETGYPLVGTDVDQGR